jgi:tRNA pseudouridine32 synthase / 23S rRNA pseudouridine746 synthase
MNPDGKPALWPIAPDPEAPELLYRDAMMLVIDKPAGLPVHPGPAAKQRVIPTLTDHLDALRFGLPRKPEAVHRLDKDTSGCLVLGRHAKALARLNDLFRQGRIGKSYWAVVEGGPSDESGLIDMALGRKDPTRGWWMKADPEGLPSQTRYRVLGRSATDGARTTWLELEPLTGRTHQLRVHCAASGWPILGDSVYGSGERDGPVTIHLHARSLSIPLYPKRDAILVTAKVPPHMIEAMAACGFAGDAEAAALPAS